MRCRVRRPKNACRRAIRSNPAARAADKRMCLKPPVKQAAFGLRILRMNLSRFPIFPMQGAENLVYYMTMEAERSFPFTKRE